MTATEPADVVLRTVLFIGAPLPALAEDGLEHVVGAQRERTSLTRCADDP
jgi:hypothetical protein